jgi:hypothetical protein
MSFFNKYLKYKSKYLKYKNIIIQGGALTNPAVNIILKYNTNLIKHADDIHVGQDDDAPYDDPIYDDSPNLISVGNIIPGKSAYSDAAITCRHVIMIGYNNQMLICKQYHYSTNDALLYDEIQHMKELCNNQIKIFVIAPIEINDDMCEIIENENDKLNFFNKYTMPVKKHTLCINQQFVTTNYNIIKNYLVDAIKPLDGSSILEPIDSNIVYLNTYPTINANYNLDNSTDYFRILCTEGSCCRVQNTGENIIIEID